MGHERELRRMRDEVMGMLREAEPRMRRLQDLKWKIERLLHEIGDPVLGLDIEEEVRRLLASREEVE